MNYDIKPKKLIRQEKAIPLTIPQLIQKYKLDALWNNIQKIVEEVIEQNSGYVIKKDGVMYIADNNVLDKAKVVLRIGKNFLDISNSGIDGNYETIISLNGIINADFIQTGEINADLITTGTLDASKANISNINAENINSGKIKGELIEGGSITSDKISSNAITSEKIATDAIEAKHIKAGAITADDITSGTMQADRIKGGTFTVGGVDNGNGTIDVQDESGKSSVIISNQGIELRNGSKLVAGNGVLSNLQFNASSVSEVYGDSKIAGEYRLLGFMYNDWSVDKYNLYIDISIPENFIINSAYITLKHIPYILRMDDGSTAYGYVRDIKCLLADMGGEVYVEGHEGSEYNINIGGIKFNEIENCFDNSGNAFTANIPSENSLKVTEVVSQNIGDKIKKHSRIKITTTDPTPTYTGDNSAIAKKCAEQTGFVFACINIFGFMQ